MKPLQIVGECNIDLKHRVTSSRQQLYVVKSEILPMLKPYWDKQGELTVNEDLLESTPQEFGGPSTISLLLPIDSTALGQTVTSRIADGTEDTHRFATDKRISHPSVVLPPSVPEG